MGQTLSKKRQETTRHDHLQCTFSSTSNNSHLISSTLDQASSPDDHLFNSTSNHDLDALKEILTNIPDDVMIEILSRLPVKSLLKFKCVSKSLLALISSPGFIKTYVSTNKKYMRQRVICCVDYPESGSDLKQFPLKSELHEPGIRATTVDYPSRYNRIRSFEIVGSYNGLVCVTFPDKRAINDEPGILLWNPSMKKYRKLPKFLTKPNSRTWKGWFMACGYGYDKSNDDYKVVTISSVHNWPMKEETVVKMYSRKTRTWKKIEKFKDGNPMHQRGHFASGGSIG